MQQLQPQPVDSFTVNVMASVWQTLRTTARNLVHGTPYGMLLAWLQLALACFPAVFMYVFTRLDGAPQPLYWALLMLPLTAGALLLGLRIHLRRPRGIRLLVLERGRVTFQRNDGSSVVVIDGLAGLEEGEHFFSIRLKQHPDKMTLGFGYTLDKRSMADDSVAILRRLGAPAEKPEPAVPHSTSWLN